MFFEDMKELKFKYVFSDADQAPIRYNKNVPKLDSFAPAYRGSLKKLLEAGQPMFVDCGAYTVHKQGGEINIDEYIEFINKYIDNIEMAAALDQIPGMFGKPKTRDEIERAASETWRNYLYMSERVVNPSVLIPIFHQGEDFKHLERMLEHKPYVGCLGISPANDLSNSRKRLWFDKVYKLVGNRKTHVFGMTSLSLLEQYPIWSADSISWVLSAGFGCILTTRQGIYSNEHVSEKTPDFIRSLPGVEDNCEKWNLDIDTLSTSAVTRRTYNHLYLMDWARNYKYRPSRKQKSLF